MKEQPRTQSRIVIVVYEKFYVHEKILLTRNCRRKLSKICFQRKYVNQQP